jgi:Uma2 family endonuclease
MAPAPDDEHQGMSTRLARPLLEIVEDTGLGVVRLGINLASDPDNWEDDYRVPDVTVFLKDSPAICHETFWSGPPDFVVEIISPWDKTRKKLEFYTIVGAREVLLVDRDPWHLELYRLHGDRLMMISKLSPAEANWIESEVLPLRIRLVPGEARPTIEVFATEQNKSWTV